MHKARVLALYLPQFHPIKENDLWWGKGFTEWTNVGKARKHYFSHYQPRVPADLGYYDLRVPESRQAQADLAREYGVEGFIYWHYWFGNGKRLLERPFDEVLESSNPDFPFALAWANTSWKGFDYGTTGRNVLIEQLYPGEDDYKEHFYSILPALKDKRYITVDNRPFFMLFQPYQLPDPSKFIALWQSLACENGLKGMHFVAQTDNPKNIDELISMGFNAVNVVRLFHGFDKERSIVVKLFSKVASLLFDRSFNIVDYTKASRHWVGPEDRIVHCYPSIFPGWDHTPRSGNKGAVLNKSTPKAFGKHVSQVLSEIVDKPEQQKIVVLKSWNEWAEGNYVEPDLRWGREYLEALYKALNS